mgnify:CR=1 FL=1
MDSRIKNIGGVYSLVGVDGGPTRSTVDFTGVDGPGPFVDRFQSRDELVVYHSMWYDGAPHQGQCEGCTFNLWHMKDAVYLNTRGVSFAVLTSGPWDEVAPYVEFMGYTEPWYSVRVVEAPIGGEMGQIRKVRSAGCASSWSKLSVASNASSATNRIWSATNRTSIRTSSA